MTILAALPFGLAIGMAHALEADHVAAVTAMRQRSDGIRAMVRRGAFWGLGHTVSLVAACLGASLLGLTMSGRLQAGVDLAVGLMIVALGANVLWRLHRDRVHVHAHDHDGERHIHFHSHAGEKAPHTASAHRHRHIGKADGKVMAIGVMHGLAGSAAFLVLMAATAQSIGEVIAYVAVFGVGTIIGMAALSAIISLPLNLAQRLGGRYLALTTGGVGCAAIVVGSMLAVENLLVIAGPAG